MRSFCNLELIFNSSHFFKWRILSRMDAVIINEIKSEAGISGTLINNDSCAATRIHSSLGPLHSVERPFCVFGCYIKCMFWHPLMIKVSRSGGCAEWTTVSETGRCPGGMVGENHGVEVTNNASTIFILLEVNSLKFWLPKSGLSFFYEKNYMYEFQNREGREICAENA